ncbi:MAG: hypothetical protein B6D55_05335 [Candidatus Omnitrophica bacterium 4484_70.2]|nr:MAG: hypothetical protein B6D55_05335 [Candidatus Omnitrophica bacterium 4484_70.2]
MNNKNSLDLFDEDQPDETPLEIPAEKRKIFFKTPTRKVKDIFSDYKRGDLDVRPAFQRGFVWDIKKASRLIESILLGVPIPVIYTAEIQDGTEIVIDGQQRLLSIFSFIDGIFPKSNKPFKLRGLDVLKELNGLSFKELDKLIQKTIENYSVPFIIITKDSDSDVKFEIFERLNTGSVKLNDQELRNCIYRGRYNDLLKELPDNQDFQFILNSPRLKERMLDRELILRFFAFYHNTYLKYKAPMKQFLNKEIEKYRNLDKNEELELRNVFKKAVDLIKSVFGDKAFRRFIPGTESDPNGTWETKKLNKGLFDIIMWGFSQYEKNQIIPFADSIREELLWLMSHDQRFIESIRVSTDKYENVQYRFDKWRESLKNIVGYPHKEPRTFSWSLKKQLYENDPICAICNQKIQILDDAEIDHIEFYWRGGKTIPSNARLVHRFCNRHRGGREK